LADTPPTAIAKSEAKIHIHSRRVLGFTSHLKAACAADFGYQDWFAFPNVTAERRATSAAQRTRVNATDLFLV
jgi:hypothetical protein